MASTLYLDPTAWDLGVDVSGNIAVAIAPYARAQDAASEIRTFTGDCYYDQGKGIPYFATTLGQPTDLELIRSEMVGAALLVPGVASAKVFFTSFSGRALAGQIQLIDESGITTTITF